MALPKIETPRHMTTLPVSGLKIEYRPFLVKEQKVLLQAMEMGDGPQTNLAIVDITNACAFEQVDVRKLPVADVEWLTLMIRSKSVGSESEILYTCPKCGHKQPEIIDITGIEVSHSDKENVIELYDGVGVTMRDLSFGDVLKAADLEKDQDKGYAIMLASIENAFDGDQVYTRNDFTDQELAEYLDNLPGSTFAKIEEYVKKQPTIQMDIKSKCLNCEHESEYTARGLANFFG